MVREDNILRRCGEVCSCLVACEELIRSTCCDGRFTANLGICNNNIFVSRIAIDGTGSWDVTLNVPTTSFPAATILFFAVVCRSSTSPMDATLVTSISVKALVSGWLHT
jgi:hypothetical protein